MKQTAVEWLIEQLIKYELVDKTIHPNNVLFYKAKEMEKEQIEDAYWASYKEGQYSGDKTADEYYNQTYKDSEQ